MLSSVMQGRRYLDPDWLSDLLSTRLAGGWPRARPTIPGAPITLAILRASPPKQSLKSHVTLPGMLILATIKQAYLVGVP